jgi:hypothetical protein
VYSDEFEQHSVLFLSGLCLFSSLFFVYFFFQSPAGLGGCQYFICSTFHTHNIINLRQANFRRGYNSTTNGLMWEWISQLYSAPQIGPETTLKVFLMVVGTWSAVGENLFFYL